MLYNPIPIDWTLEQKTDENGKRFYSTPSGAVYPSVTTVVGWEKNAFFAKWRAENPQESVRVLKRGNDLHKLMEDWISTGVLAESNETYLALQLQGHLKNFGRIYGQEIALWSDLLRLAGRTDCIAEYRGKLSVVDFKGSTRAKRIDDIEQYFLQATAYAIMWQERTGIAINQIVILISCEDGITQEIIRNTNDYVPRLKAAIDRYEALTKQRT
jgi:genome maintenance exonuclease 1